MGQDHYREYIDKKFIALSIALSLIFWLAFTWILAPLVPTFDPFYAYLFGGFAALCLTGVFYIATHMFRLVLAEHLKARRSRS